MSLGEPIPRNHAGILARFGDRVVQEGHVSREIGRGLRRALGFCNRACYDPHGPDLPSQAREVLDLARTLVETWERRGSGQG